MAEWLKRQLRRLLVLPFPPADISEHEKALADIPEPVMTAAVDYALRTRTKYPVPSELRADADHVAPLAVLDEPLPTRERALEQPFTITVPEVGTVISVTREWKYYDDRCSDTGWASWWCGPPQSRHLPWIPFGQCQRHGEHQAHEWVSRCECWASNPALIRKREAIRKYSEAPNRVA